MSWPSSSPSRPNILERSPCLHVSGSRCQRRRSSRVIGRRADPTSAWGACRAELGDHADPDFGWSKQTPFFFFYRIVTNQDTHFRFNLCKAWVKLWLEIELRSYLCCARIGGESPIYSQAPTSYFEFYPPQTLVPTPCRRHAVWSHPQRR
jgi:hypothetical protein